MKYILLGFKTQEIKSASAALGTRLFLRCGIIGRYISVFGLRFVLVFSHKTKQTKKTQGGTSCDVLLGPLKTPSSTIKPSPEHSAARLICGNVKSSRVSRKPEFDTLFGTRGRMSRRSRGGPGERGESRYGREIEQKLAQKQTSDEEIKGKKNT